MLNLFSKERFDDIKVDFHSHLIPGIDDGVKTIDEAIEIVTLLSSSGIEKIITTPHIASEFYCNTPAIIKKGLLEVQNAILDLKIPVTLEAAAEYYIDAEFMKKIDTDEEILTFGNNNILVETPFINKPHFFEEVVFKMKSRGLNPIFAHPERYEYIQDSPEYLKELKKLGMLFQVTAISFTGYYSKSSKKIAEWMSQNNLVDFIGSDIHNQRHCKNYISFRQSKKYRKLLKLNLLNNTL